MQSTDLDASPLLGLFRIGHFQAQLLELQCLLQRARMLCIFVQIYLSAARWFVVYYTVSDLNLHTIFFSCLQKCLTVSHRLGERGGSTKITMKVSSD